MKNPLKNAARRLTKGDSSNIFTIRLQSDFANIIINNRLNKFILLFRTFLNFTFYFFIPNINITFVEQAN